ncbi:hypothetical protein G9409_10040 [Chlorobium sp. BLA1]|uniref:DUF2515 family protein n=1 Tax=Candidatus Chlorobium masyuteum TaxID=2716876 RepID=UPI001421854F|nr:hypothetical protein [Candidatus Chlorobium masyuteum]NHQ60913.1 hypothetical protein [Candidatus Chlorobium masyuteum]
MARSKEEWIELLEHRLPPLDKIADRNRAITAHYARWYLEKPELFKWSGMAAFASRQVGVALGVCELLHAPEHRENTDEQEGGLSSFDAGKLLQNTFNNLLFIPSFMHSVAAQQFFLADLDQLRLGNNNIFADIGWAHALFLESGFGALEKCCGLKEQEFLFEGFRLIDEGDQLIRRGVDEERAHALIWEGNVLLLRHEQISTLQPIFDAISQQGRILISFGSELDFSGGVRASFSTYSGYFETLTGMKSVTDSRHRWQWIEHDVLPAWKRMECTFCEGSPLKRELEVFAAMP